MSTRDLSRRRTTAVIRPRGVVVAVLGLLALAVLAAVGSPGVQAAQPPVHSGSARLASVASEGDDDSSVTQTHEWLDDKGTSRSGTVTVSQTRDLATRQIVDISWSGFMPTTNSYVPGQTVHSAPQTPLASGYPVVLLECQGDVAAAMRQQDCAITGPSRFYDYAIYDANETDAVHDANRFDSRSFIDSGGKEHTADTYQLVELPSDFNDSNVIGTNWYATWTNDDGTHHDARFEVRSSQEAPQSLGCGDPDSRMHGACSIVVVPIRPMDCIDDHCTPPDDYQGNSANWKQWQSESNWRNRFVFPVSFKPFPDVCKLDSRLAVPTQGSEMLNRAMLSWLPKFCTTSSLFKLSFTRVNDDAARRNLDYQIAGRYSTDLAFTTRPASSIRGRPVVNAPVAVTGFAVALQFDDKNFEQIDQVDLNARLLAKLITESYNAPPDPNVDENPQGLLTDPEFLQLNPGLADQLPPATLIRNPILVQGSPDLVYEVTRYIASDPTAVAWLNGKPDPWGMTVNPYYKGKQYPVPNAQFQIRDPYIWKGDTRECEPKPVMEQVAQFVYNLGSLGDAMINRQPQDYLVCQVVGSGGDQWAWAHSARQLLGQRALLAVMDIPSAEAYQFPMAALQNHSGSYVKPTLGSLRSALSVAHYDAKTGTLSADLDSDSKTAYPGLMPVYAAAPTYGLTPKLADRYATMIDWLSTTGQVYGDKAGQLPDGYLALPSKLQSQAAAAAAHVRKQDCAGRVTGDTSCNPPPPPTTPPPPPTTPPPPSTPPATTIPTTSISSPLPTVPAPSSGLPPTTASTTPTSTETSAPTSAPPPAPAAYTTSQKSSLAVHLLPALLVVGLIGLLAAPVLVLYGRGGSLTGRPARTKATPKPKAKPKSKQPRAAKEPPNDPTEGTS